jgi:excisionase family DNA binding protein
LSSYLLTYSQMNITELAKQLKVSRQTIYDRIKVGKIKTRQNFGGSIYISKAEVERLLKEVE